MSGIFSNKSSLSDFWSPESLFSRCAFFNVLHTHPGFIPFFFFLFIRFVFFFFPTQYQKLLSSLPSSIEGGCPGKFGVNYMREGKIVLFLYVSLGLLDDTRRYQVVPSARSSFEKSIFFELR